MHCNKYGTELPENSFFCQKCGTDLTDTRTALAQQPQQSPSKSIQQKDRPSPQTDTIAHQYINQSAAGAAQKYNKKITIIIAAALLTVGAVIAVAISTNGFDFDGAGTALQLANEHNSCKNNSGANTSPAYDTVNILGEDYDIAAVTDLDLDFCQITDDTLKEIAPKIKKLTNLKRLNLSGNKITDITPLTELTGLTGLFLDDNQVTDITPLAGLTDLTGLNLSSNQITDIAPLGGLTNLR